MFSGDLDLDTSDDDFDTLPAWLEHQLGTDPDVKDTDGDGISDGEEVGTPSAPLDSDGDGVIDALELDSDDGGEPDRTERLAGRNPRVAEDDLTGDPIVVTTPDDEADGGAGAALLAEVGGANDVSFREALTLSENNPGVQEILFDPIAFPPAAGTTILVSPALGAMPRIDSVGVVIDGGDSGVIISGESDPNLSGLILGGELIRIHRLTLRDFGGALNACLGFDSATNVLVDTVDIRCETPTTHAARLDSSGRIRLHNVNARSGGHAVRIETSNSVIISDCTLMSTEFGTFATGSTDVTLLSSIMESSEYGAHLENPGPFFLFGNTLRNNTEDGLWLEAGVTATLSGNIITGNQQSGISFGVGTIDLSENSVTANVGAGLFDRVGGTPAPPILLSFTEGSLTGTTTAPDGARIEVFVDPEDEGGVPVGFGTSESGAFEIGLEIPWASGQNLTATVTSPMGQTSVFSDPLPIPPSAP